jgi:archaellum biogenesis protein FlaJ (TadC family)
MSGAIEDFRSTYKKSGLNQPFDDYLRLGKIALSVTFGLSFFLIATIHAVLLNVVGLQLIVASLALTLIPTGIMAFTLIYLPYHRKGQAKNRIDNSLIYTISYMTILSTSGLSIERIIENITVIEEKGSLKMLGTKFLANIRLFGLDINTSLKDMAERSPSPTLTRLIEGINNVQKTSGDMKNLLNFNYIRILNDKRKDLTKMLNTLTYVGETYITLMVVAPIMFIFMLTIFTIISVGSDSEGAALQLNILVFFAIPLFASGFLVVLDTILGVDD